MTVFLSVFLAAGTYAQDCRERLIDSLSNPGLSPEGRALKFDTAVMDAGTVKEDAAPREYEFFWTNAGDTPVTVVKVTTDCGCAVPSFDSVPVEPGERSSLKITYYPKGRPGNFSRRIFVYADVPEALKTENGHKLVITAAERICTDAGSLTVIFIIEITVFIQYFRRNKRNFILCGSYRSFI